VREVLSRGENGVGRAVSCREISLVPERGESSQEQEWGEWDIARSGARPSRCKQPICQTEDGGDCQGNQSRGAIAEPTDREGELDIARPDRARDGEIEKKERSGEEKGRFGRV